MHVNGCMFCIPLLCEVGKEEGGPFSEMSLTCTRCNGKAIQFDQMLTIIEEKSIRSDILKVAKD